MPSSRNSHAPRASDPQITGTDTHKAPESVKNAKRAVRRENRDAELGAHGVREYYSNIAKEKKDFVARRLIERKEKAF